MRLPGGEVLIPSRPALTVIVTLHAIWHGTEIKPRTADDLRRALERFDDAEWRRAAELGAALGSLEAFTAGLFTAAEGQALADQWRSLRRPLRSSVFVWANAPRQASNGSTYSRRVDLRGRWLDASWPARPLGRRDAPPRPAGAGGPTRPGVELHSQTAAPDQDGTARDRGGPPRPQEQSNRWGAREPDADE